MNANDVIIRSEKKIEYRKVENLFYENKGFNGESKKAFDIRLD